MQTSPAGIQLIKSFEGLSFTSYVCPAGVLTIGYGHTGPDVTENQRVTEQQAESLLKKDVAWAEDAVNKDVKVPLNQNQFDALVSFTYNTGAAAFADSTLLRRLNSGEDPSTVAKEELIKWCHGDQGEVLQGLVRRRSAEIQMFCQAPAQPNVGVTTITSRQQTWFKKKPVDSDTLPNDQKAKVYQGRTIRNCEILAHEAGHTYLQLGFGLGDWWVFDAHWDGIYTDSTVKQYAQEGSLRSLRNFPYFWQQNNGPEGWRECQTSSIAMVLKYLDVPGINDDVDYLKYVNKYGDTTNQLVHLAALKELNVSAKFRQTLSAQDFKGQIDKGLPVVAGVLHHGPVSNPYGGGHFIVITGYSDTFWQVQDPFGELDLINGVWENQGPTAGQNQHYSFQNLNPRIFVGGDNNGWAWIDFKYPA